VVVDMACFLCADKPGFFYPVEHVCAGCGREFCARCVHDLPEDLSLLRSLLFFLPTRYRCLWCGGWIEEADGPQFI
jgi:hypothetical protein